MTDVLYPEIDPLESGLLPVGHGNTVYWELSGHPAGSAALYLHGGPGSSLGSGRYRRLFDPARYRIVGLDQRGCGRSRPLAIDALDRLADNNTNALIADIEVLRRHLGITRWVVVGVSWGVTLALAYAEAHPERVSRMVLGAITTTSREEVDWITGSIGRIFPEAFERFAEDSKRRDGERIVEAYARRLAGDDVADRIAAARAWNDWESTHVSLDPNWSPITARFDEDEARAFATLVTHYWAHDGFLRKGREILAGTDRLAGIPAVLFHGRRDIGSPAVTAYRLHQQWPASRLIMLPEEGHGGPVMAAAMRRALDET
ncbi:proline iminopeptidase [Kaistia soli DSM 19436]|uniref:Proline iminopeptidase n=1 Tax=Kaistia soli DSM 19436 TaxID=1122133 RepID=A0A1M4ZCH9_9HYPH|nr:prolyl aminopeptidase [Kaistia soli]SHF15721.1 proline iminopeptidase [Kaistia soli DSM 19436]